MIGMVECETTRNGVVSHERRYRLCSQVMPVEVFADAVRAHWGGEPPALGSRLFIRQGPMPAARLDDIRAGAG